MESAIIAIVAALLLVVLLLYRPLQRSRTWTATLIPLASIMGSGFLVSAPLLAASVGRWSAVAMAGLLAVAYAIGGAIRYNIAHFEPVADEPGVRHTIEQVSQWVLAGAYLISVTYYIQLLAAFALQGLGIEGDHWANGISTAVLCVIGGVGIISGLDLLARVEKYAVSVNLAMIGGLIAALVMYNGGALIGGDWELPNGPDAFDGSTVRRLLGLLIVVQGFETSRYLGDEYDAETRIRSMRIAQRVAIVVYMLFIVGATVLFHDGLSADVTAVIQMTQPIAPILPVLITVAALGSQFSAAVADEAGAGGLVESISHRRIPVAAAYALITAATVGLTWATDVHTIIATASRAFALFYCLQCAIAALTASKQGRTGHALWFAALSVVGALVCVLGLPVE